MASVTEAPEDTSRRADNGSGALREGASGYDAGSPHTINAAADVAANAPGDTSSSPLDFEDSPTSCSTAWTGARAPSLYSPLSSVHGSDVSRARPKPHALSFLDSESPPATQETARPAAKWRQPSFVSERPAKSAVSSAVSTRARSGSQPEMRSVDTGERRYGTPEMPRGSVKHPHRAGNVLTPRLPKHNHAKHLPRAEKLPMTGYELLANQLTSLPRRPQRRDSFGSSSSTSDLSEAGQRRLKPIYRRFESLNHRLLLHLQDELAELEEQLHRLDTADTQTRRLRNSIIPASRRSEYIAGGELQWHRTDILGKIGYKLGQYNHALTTFNATRALPVPASADVADYREYLASRAPIAENETRFLDPLDDLVSLAADISETDSVARPPSLRSENTTPVPGKRGFVKAYLADDASTGHVALNADTVKRLSACNPSVRRQPGVASSTGAAASASAIDPTAPPSWGRRCSPSAKRLGREAHRTRHDAKRGVKHEAAANSGAGPAVDDAEPVTPALLARLALAIASAILLPVLTFKAIPGLMGRLAVVLLVAVVVVSAQFQTALVARLFETVGTRDLVACAVVYAGVMAVVAGVVG